MKILALKNIEREEGYIYYLRKFTCDAVVELPTDTLNTPIEFSIESSPLGTKTIEIEVRTSINYPLLPIKKALKEFILIEDSEGKLPW